MEITVTQKAERAIDNIAQYISDRGYPAIAVQFISRLKDFIYTIGDYPYKYAKCRGESYSKRAYRCAVFEKHYIIIYKVHTSRIVIHNVVHTAKMRE
ncbi:MAG: type II toxin-antitoxin system RelE/ParE family toxin [Bacteroidales bacterium]|nr:type II toxin-antitoxin system RelE/ParE family toxin [Bacteroidales bacterium]MCF8334162.1 type II toxin-antitoxin system RelE/ParE family toxin [Bacteroidales bacterium]